MNWKNFQRTVLAATLFAGVAVAAQAQIDVRITTGRPPALRHEVRDARPGPDHVWVAGRWHWDNARWNWVGGRWERPAAPQAYWITPRYVRTSRGTIYEPGHWSNQTLVVGDDVRSRKEWQRHEKDHERELQRERERERYDHDRDHNP